MYRDGVRRAYNYHEWEACGCTDQVKGVLRACLFDELSALIHEVVLACSSLYRWDQNILICCDIHGSKLPQVKKLV